MLHAIATLLMFQLIGEVLTQSLKLPVPGPVVGMLLLFLALAVRMPLAQHLRTSAQGMLQHLSLLFVPAGVGVMLHVGRLTNEWLAVAAALVLSTLLTIAVTALTIDAVARVLRARGGGG